MNISKKWLSQYMDLEDVTIEEIADRITAAGLEVEGLKKLSEGSKLVIGEVLFCEDHPDSDHLHICQVDIKDSKEQIVCGAPNVAAGQKVIVAKVGAKLPGGEIKAGVIRGQSSNGMICSLLELGVDPHQLSEESKNGIEVLDQDAPVGCDDPLGYLGLDDAVLDVGLTPNRSDCMAAWAMALETGAVLHKKVTLPSYEHAAAAGKPTKLTVCSTSKKCPLFLGKVIGSVTIKPSPKWMRELLMAAGMKSINNVVDISNIVMLETGQPLHFYDKEAIPSQEITVKDDLECTYTALDGTAYEIHKGDLMITTNDQPIGIAGIMGGNDSKIEETTKGIIIEAAVFHHVSIRNTSRRLNLGTDASVRYQKGIEPLAAFKAMDRAVSLLVEYADAKELEETVQYGDNGYTPTLIDVDLSRINHLLGTDFLEEEVISVLERLHLQPMKKEGMIRVQVPSYRQDLKIEADIAEEIIRIIGYDRLPSTLPTMPATVGALNARQALRRRLCTMLTSMGYQEAETYTLISKEKLQDGVMPLADPIALASPMSEERTYVRSSILPSLIDVIAYNQARSMKDLAFFEISNVYGKDIVEERIAIAMCGDLQKNRWQKRYIPCDFYTVKGLILSLLSMIGFDGRRISIKENSIDVQHFHPYQSAAVYLGKELLAVIGNIHPVMAKQYGVSDRLVMAEMKLDVILHSKASKIKYVPISKYPAVSRDLAFVVDQDVKVEDIITNMQKHGKLGKGNIIQHIEVFDVYTGEHVEAGKKSIALSITFQSDEMTLKDEHVNKLHNDILASLEKEMNAVLRG